MPPPEPRSILAPCLAIHTSPAPTAIRCIPHPIAQPLIWPPLAAKVAPFFAARNTNALATKSGLYWRATSRGLRAKTAANEGPISELAAYRLTAEGVPFDWERFPVQLSEADLRNADLVVALKKAKHYVVRRTTVVLAQHPMTVERFPAWADRITDWQIDDMECATANEALPICESCVKALVDRLLAEQETQ